MATPHHDPVDALTRRVRTHLPTLPRPTARVLAGFAYAACLVRSASVLRCASVLAAREHAPLARVRQRLREFYREGEHKRGAHRRTLDARGCFGALCRWAIDACCPGPEIVLALDPSLCRDRLACLCVSLVTDELSIPVAWSIVPANDKGAWLSRYIEIIHALGDALRLGGAARRPVYVLCDRGLFSKALFRAVTGMGWHPLFRVPANGYWTTSRGRRVHLRDVVTVPGTSHRASGRLHKDHPLACTLVGLWQAGYAEPWLIVTDARPAQASAHLYRLRAKIERLFRTAKSDVFDWEHSRIGDPARAQRLWLVYAVAMLLLAEEAQQATAAGLGAVGLCRSDVWEGLSRRMSQMRLGQMVLWRDLFESVEALVPAMPAANSS